MPKLIPKEKKLTMFCARCSKEQEKIGFFDSGSGNIFDGYFYCQGCFMKIFNQLPEKKKGEFSFYEERKTRNS